MSVLSPRHEGDELMLDKGVMVEVADAGPISRRVDGDDLVLDKGVMIEVADAKELWADCVRSWLSGSAGQVGKG